MFFLFGALLFKEPFEPFFGKVNVLFFGLRRALFEAVQDIHYAVLLPQFKQPCIILLDKNIRPIR